MIAATLAHALPALLAAGPDPTATPNPTQLTGVNSASENAVALDPALKAFIRWLIFFLNAAGALVIGVAAVRGFLIYLIDLVAQAGRAVPSEMIRLSLGRALALALEFQLGADILGTALDPTNKDLIILGTIVILRTILNFFLGREPAEGRRLVESEQEGSRDAGLARWLLPASDLRREGPRRGRDAPG